MDSQERKLVALVAPSCRHAVISSGRSRATGEYWSQIEPVLAFAEYRFDPNLDSPNAPDDRQVVSLPVTADSNRHPERDGDEILMQRRVVCCPWPPSEDEVRLAPLFAEAIVWDYRDKLRSDEWIKLLKLSRRLTGAETVFCMTQLGGLK